MLFLPQSPSPADLQTRSFVATLFVTNTAKTTVVRIPVFSTRGGLQIDFPTFTVHYNENGTISVYSIKDRKQYVVMFDRTDVLQRQAAHGLIRSIVPIAPLPLPPILVTPYKGLYPAQNLSPFTTQPAFVRLSEEVLMFGKRGRIEYTLGNAAIVPWVVSWTYEPFGRAGHRVEFWAGGNPIIPKGKRRLDDKNWVKVQMAVYDSKVQDALLPFFPCSLLRVVQPRADKPNTHTP